MAPPQYITQYNFIWLVLTKNDCKDWLLHLGILWQLKTDKQNEVLMCSVQDGMTCEQLELKDEHLNDEFLNYVALNQLQIDSASKNCEFSIKEEDNEEMTYSTNVEDITDHVSHYSVVVTV